MEKSIAPRTKLITAMVIWGTIGIFVRNIKLSSIEIAFFRACLGSGFLILISLINRDKIDKKLLKENLLVLSVSGLALGINWIALFQAMKFTTISNATLSYYFAPVFITIFSAIIFKEKMTVKNIICLAGAILGLFLIVKSGDSENVNGYNHLKGILYGLSGAVLYATIVMLNKYIKGLSGFQATLIQLFVAALVLIPMVSGKNSINFLAMDTKTWVFILILGIVHTGIAYLLYFPSIKDVRSQSIAMLSYLDPIVAILMSFVFLGESMGVAQIIGGVLILSTSYINER